MLGLVCRVVEGAIGGLSISVTLALFWLAKAKGADAPDPAAAHALAGYLLRDDVALTATFFAVGSMAFTYLFLRGRMIPAPLAWLGVGASALLVIALPLQLAGWLRGAITSLIWLPMLAFEVPLGVWLLTWASPRRARDTDSHIVSHDDVRPRRAEEALRAPGGGEISARLTHTGLSETQPPQHPQHP